MSTRARTAVEGYFAAINEDRFDALTHLFVEHVEIHTVGAKPVAGRDAAITHFRNLLDRFVEHEDRVTRWIEAVAGNSGNIVTDIAFTGRLRDGRAVNFSALDVFDIDDGRITKVATWYDTREVYRQVRPP